MHQALRNPGTPADPGTRGLMEARLGVDFSRVRVHARGAGNRTSALPPGIGNAAVSRMPGPARPAPAPVQRSAVHDVLSSPGQPLAAPVKEEMEARLGADFSQVRVHTHPAARASAAALSARAYTCGSHVVIGDGGADKHTLAHELTHVIQQRQGPVTGTDHGNGLKVSDPADPSEEAAAATAARAMSGPMPGRPTREAPTRPDLAAIALRGSGIQRFQGWDHGGQPSPIPVQRIFTQNSETLQEHSHGGVKSQYDSSKNIVEFHIEAGANQQGKLLEDFLLALYEARDALQAGEASGAKVPGHLFMRPQGAQVLKMTMEMLGEAVGTEAQRGRAREAQQARKETGLPSSSGVPKGREEEVIGPLVVPEHIRYRESLVGVPGVTIRPTGGGTSGGTVNMLVPGPPAGREATPEEEASAAERKAYDEALAALQPLSIGVTVDLAVVNRIIAMMERNAGPLASMALKIRRLFKG